MTPRRCAESQSLHSSINLRLGMAQGIMLFFDGKTVDHGVERGEATTHRKKG